MQLSLSVLHVAHSAGGLLGVGHPLVRVLNAMTVRVEQSVVVLAVMSAGGIALAAGVSQALGLIVGTAVVQSALTGSLALLVSDRRAHVRDLIIDGRDSLPLAVVQRERRRLLAPAYRAPVLGGRRRCTHLRSSRPSRRNWRRRPGFSDATR
jgi:hypothetical protein